MFHSYACSHSTEMLRTLLLQQAVDQDPESEKAEDGLVKHIQGILYSSEVRLGFP